MEKERIVIHPVPINIEDYSFIGPFAFKKINALQGIVVGLLVTFLLFNVINYFEIFQAVHVLGFSIAIGGGVFFLALFGIRGDSLFGYFKTLISFRKNKRSAFYNPRVKKEIKTIGIDALIGASLPREKLQKAYKKVRRKLNERNQKNAQELNAVVSEEIIFSDDIKEDIQEAAKKKFNFFRKEEQ